MIEEAIYAAENIKAKASKVTDAKRQDLCQRLDQFVDCLPESWLRDGRLLSGLGEAYGELGQFERAVELYDAVRGLEHATFPLRALEQLANLPTLDQARAMLLGLFQAPAEKFVRTLAEPHAKLVRLLAAYKDQQDAA